MAKSLDIGQYDVHVPETLKEEFKVYECGVRDPILENSELVLALASRLALKEQEDTERSNNDTHYRNCAIEPIEIIEANDLDYHEGNVLKYLLRWRHKGGIADLEKAIWYLERLIATTRDDK